MFNNFMNLALEQAYQAFNKDEVPVGAIIVDAKSKQVIAEAHNRNIELNDPTAHAEMLVIREAAKIIEDQRLVDCELYVTLEPCPMCAQAISFARIKRLYFGAYDPKSGGIETGARIFSQSSCHFVPETYGGILEKKCSELMQRFFVELRQNKTTSKL